MAEKWDYHRPGPATSATTVIVPKGSRLEAIGQQLQDVGVVRSAKVFALDAKLQQLRGRPSLKAGEYAFDPAESLADLMLQMQSGRVVIHRITIPEGFTNKQIAMLLTAESALSGDIGALPDEGRLLPETYTFTRGDSRTAVVERMKVAAAHALEEAWFRRDVAAPAKSREQALIMASLIEKETGVPDERAKVAAVFYNRLKAGMKLQSDPTVIYALSDGLGQIPRPLGHSDLSLVSPYNTYLIAGLPPQPICNPGRAALDAALHPLAEPYLYFVATGHGGHAFATTVEEHNRNVADYVKTLHDGLHDKP
jgi:UPF0755 protein